MVFSTEIKRYLKAHLIEYFPNIQELGVIQGSEIAVLLMQILNVETSQLDQQSWKIQSLSENFTI